MVGQGEQFAHLRHAEAEFARTSHECQRRQMVLRIIAIVAVGPVCGGQDNHETSHANGENEFIQRLISENVVKVVQMDDAAARLFETMIRSPGSLDDGEAATIAVAVSQGFLPVVDERKGRARAQDLMNGQAPAWSLDMLVHPAVQSELVGDGYIEAVYLALRVGRMRIDEGRCEAVAGLIGFERVLTCNSLPGFKERKGSWIAK